MKHSFLDENQRKLLRYGVVLMLLVFLTGYYFFFIKKGPPPVQTRDNVVTLEGNKLHVFGGIYTVNTYPDKAFVHYPYLIIVQANKSLSTVYNLETKQKEQEINEILIDYYNGNTIHNKEESYYNNASLGHYCDSAFIKDDNEVLCIKKQTRESSNNMLISINTAAPNHWKEVHKSKNLLTTVSVINNVLYVGEINAETKQNYITVDRKTIPAPNVVSMIYPLNGVPFFASFESALNGGEAGYYQLDDNSVAKVNGEMIVLYE